MGLFGNLKDSAVSAIIKSKVNDKIKEFGNMISINLDSSAKTINLSVLLKGEEKLITATASYEVLPPTDEGAVLKLSNISCSKTWMDVVVRDMLSREKTVVIPTKYASMVGLVL